MHAGFVKFARHALLFEIVLAPLALGGARPWALAILLIPIGVGLIAMAAGWPSKNDLRNHLSLPWRGLAPVWAMALLLAGWMVVQALPIWPDRLIAPFQGKALAISPDALFYALARWVWMLGVFTLAVLIARSTKPVDVSRRGTARGSRFADHLIHAVIFSAALQASLAFVLTISGTHSTFWFAKTAHIDDFTGTFANRNAFSALMATGLISCLTLWHRAVRQGTQSIDQYGGWLALAVMFIFALAGSHSRGGIIAAAIGTVCFFLLRIHQINIGSIWTKSIKSAICIGAAIITTVGIIAMTPGLAARFFDLARSDLIQRDDAWRTALVAISHRPWTGYGPGSIPAVFDHFASPGLNLGAQWHSSHNLLLDACLVWGLPATVIVLTGTGLGLWIIKRSTSQRDRHLLWLTTILMMWLVQSMLDWVTFLPAIILPLLIAAGNMAGELTAKSSPQDLPATSGANPRDAAPVAARAPNAR